MGLRSTFGPRMGTPDEKELCGFHLTVHGSEGQTKEVKIENSSVHTVVTVFQLVTGLPTQPMVVTLGGSLLVAGVLGEGSLVG